MKIEIKHRFSGAVLFSCEAVWCLYRRGNDASHEV
jgi:hypothetical protein